MVPLLPLRDGVRALPISFFRQSMPSFYMNAPDCICSPGRLPLGAFCTGRDGRYGQDWPTRCAFQSTHPVRGATPLRLGLSPRLRRFQSTHPMRGATVGGRAAVKLPIDFNPRTPCGVRLLSVVYKEGYAKYFNPRTPCGVRPACARCAARHANFNPRTPCGVRPAPAGGLRGGLLISIHAPRAGCDLLPHLKQAVL